MNRISWGIMVCIVAKGKGKSPRSFLAIETFRSIEKCSFYTNLVYQSSLTVLARIHLQVARKAFHLYLLISILFQLLS